MKTFGLLLVAMCLACPAYGGAVLAISSCASDTTGAIWTCHVSGGGAGSLTPTSAITGFTPHLILGGVGSQIATSTVTASGTGASGTVVVTAAMPAQSGEAITLDWLAGGNLTDGTNTASVQSGVHVTNNSAVTGLTLGTAAASVYSLGRWIGTTCSSYGNRTCSYAKGSYSVLEFQFTPGVSTDVAFNMSDSSTFYISVDGGGEIAIAQGATTQKWTWNHGATLAAGAHDIKLSIHSSGAYLLTAAAIRISSASGATCCTDMPAYDGTYYTVGASPFNTLAQNEGALLATDAQQNYSGALYAGSGAALMSVRWYGTGFSSILAWVYGGSGVFKVYMDGVHQGSYTASGTKWTVGTLASGLDKGHHLWEVVFAGNGYIFQILAPVGATVGPTKPPARPYIAVYGDSIVAGVNLSGYPNDRTGIDYFGYPALNASFMGAGAIGQPVSVCANGCIGTSNYLRDHTSQIATIVKPTIAVAEGGINDEIYACGKPCTANPPAQFTIDYTAMLTNMAGNMQAGGLIVARGVQPYNGNNSSTIAAWRAAQLAGVVAYNASKTNGVTAFFVDPTGWVNTTTDLVGGLHPNDTGYAKMRLRMIAIEQAAILVRSSAWMSF